MGPALAQPAVFCWLVMRAVIEPSPFSYRQA
jgi:hypothetical protein